MLRTPHVYLLSMAGRDFHGRQELPLGPATHLVAFFQVSIATTIHGVAGI